ncbi:MAG: hypothetical protein VYC34_12295, partial [Planctomycetota bacterium]|nr:hypothetical protein [Planctomycetota bacterium]
ALLNFAFLHTTTLVGPGQWSTLAGPLLVFAAIAMPTACALAAASKRNRWTFAAPVTALITACALTLFACVTWALEVQS